MTRVSIKSVALSALREKPMSIKGVQKRLKRGRRQPAYSTVDRAVKALVGEGLVKVHSEPGGPKPTLYLASRHLKGFDSVEPPRHFNSRSTMVAVMRDDEAPDEIEQMFRDLVALSTKKALLRIIKKMEQEP